MATSGYFNTSSVGNFYFTFEWYRTGYDSSRNEHYIDWTLIAHNSPGSYRTVYLRDLWVAGDTRYWEDWGVRYYDGDVVASGSLTVSSYNSEGDGWFDAGFDAGVGISSGSNCSGGSNWDLDRIPRYTTVWNSERGKTINSVSINWSTSDARDWTQYSLNDGGWTDAWDTVAWDNKSGYYTISNLQPNTTYKVKTRCRRADSGLWSEAGDIWITTYDIAKISNAPNIEHSNNLSVTYSNPSGSPTEISVYKTDGLTTIAGYRSCSGNSYTFQFTDEELDRLYKAYGYSNQITLRAYIKTSGNYLHYAEFVVTLKGKQKTMKINKDDIWKRGQLYVKRNGAWKKGIIWINDNDVWKRGI